MNHGKFQAITMMKKMIMEDGRYEDDHCDGDNYYAEDKMRMNLTMKTPTLL